MKRNYDIAIYARYSTDMQNKKSTDDQFRLCMEYAKKHFSFNIADKYYDNGISGTDGTRPGVNDLIANLYTNKYQIVLCESIDRLSRNMAFMARFYDICEYNQVKIYSVQDGLITKLHIGFKGTSNALMIDNISAHSLRAKLARAHEGRIPAGICYGYDNDIRVEGSKIERGFRKINHEKAKIVKQIFIEFDNNIPVSQICHKLNQEGVPSPSGHIWRTNTILGSYKRLDGLLSNTLYSGVYVYNKKRLITDPLTGRSKNILKPEAEWVSVNLPELAIIDKALFNRVQDKLHQNKYNIIPPKSKTYHKKPLTSLIFCECGSLKVLHSKSFYVCKNAKYIGRCKNNRGTNAKNIYDMVLNHINCTMLDNYEFYYAVKNYYDGIDANIKKLNNDITNINNKRINLMDFMEKGIDKSGLVERFNELSIKQNQLKIQLNHDTKLLSYKINNLIVLNSIIHKLSIILNANFDKFIYARKITEIFKCFIEKVKALPDHEKTTGEIIEFVRVKEIDYIKFWTIANELIEVEKTN